MDSGDFRRRVIVRFDSVEASHTDYCRQLPVIADPVRAMTGNSLQ
jgi:hypothetical protein